MEKSYFLQMFAQKRATLRGSTREIYKFNELIIKKWQNTLAKARKL